MIFQCLIPAVFSVGIQGMVSHWHIFSAGVLKATSKKCVNGVLVSLEFQMWPWGETRSNRKNLKIILPDESRAIHLQLTGNCLYRGKGRGTKMCRWPPYLARFWQYFENVWCAVVFERKVNQLPEWREGHTELVGVGIRDPTSAAAPKYEGA